MLPRIVVTGYGVISPAGVGSEALQSVLEGGRSCTTAINDKGFEHLKCKVGGVIQGFNPLDYVDKHEVKRLDRCAQLFFAAGSLALNHGSFFNFPSEPVRIGIYEGSSLGGLTSVLDGHEALIKNGQAHLNPFYIMKAMNGIGGSMLALHHGFHGPVINYSSGSVSSATSIMGAISALQLEQIDMAIAGGAESPIHPHVYSLFENAGVLSTYYSEPSKSCRPFDKSRDGITLAEAGVCLLLERLEDAKAKGKKIYGEILGSAMTNDSVNLVAPASDAIQQSESLKMALGRSHVKPEQIDCISAHGTSTQLNDKTETKAIHLALGDEALRIPVYASKSMLGHSLGACTALELVIAMIAMENNFVPPTINLETVDPECNLNYQPNIIEQKDVNLVVVKNSSFGGKNTAFVIAKCKN